MSDDTSDKDQHARQVDHEAQLTERVWFSATERAVKYLKFRYLWMPTTISVLFVLLSFVGFSNWVKLLTREEISKTLQEQLQSASLRIDSLVTKADSSVVHLKNAEYLSGQMQILMKQYQFIIATTAEKSRVSEKVDILEIMKKRFDVIDAGKGFQLTFSRVGNPERISVFIAKEDSIYTIFEMPVSLIKSHLDELIAKEIYIDPPPRDAPPTFVVRGQFTFATIEEAGTHMATLYTVLLGPGPTLVEYYDWSKRRLDSSSAAGSASSNR